MVTDPNKDAADAKKAIEYKTADDAFLVGAVLGTGSFGKVVAAIRKSDDADVALKLIKLRSRKGNSMREMRFCKELRDMGAFNHNIIHVFDSFFTPTCAVLVMEQLGPSLYEYWESKDKQLPLNEVRPIFGQLLHGLHFLNKHQFVHADLKPQNVVMIDVKSLRVKIVDFGSAFHAVFGAHGNDNIQTRPYRAPEVILGLRWVDNSIDMWSLGCLVVELFIGEQLFPGFSDFQLLKFFIETLGMPPRHMMGGKTVNKYFTRVQAKSSSHYRFKNIHEFMRNGIIRPNMAVITFFRLQSLDDMVNFQSLVDLPDWDRRDREEFVKTVKKMLVWNPHARIDAGSALELPFFTQDHLMSCENQEYFETGWKNMAACFSEKHAIPPNDVLIHHCCM